MAWRFGEIRLELSSVMLSDVGGQFVGMVEKNRNPQGFTMSKVQRSTEARRLIEFHQARRRHKLTSEV